MSLIERLDQDFKQALKEKDSEKLSVLRLVRSSIKNLEISKQGEASDQDAVSILQKEVKQHKESLDAFKKAKRDESVSNLENEIEILEQYLPDQLSSDELKDVVDKAIIETQASSMSDVGKVMGKVMPQVQGRAGGDIVGNMVRDILQNK